jgi:NAD-dependent deacetylase sirtuin 5
MSRSVPKSSFGPSSDVEEFGDVLMGSRRILALCGAGLSAASGLDTFRGAGGMWRNHEATSLATPEAFARDPGLVVSRFSVSSSFTGTG